MIVFISAIFLLLATPGPGVLTTAGVGSGYGYADGVRYVTGLFIGTNFVALAVVTGLAALLLANPILKTALFWLSTSYLLYLAYKIAFSGSKIAFVSPPKAPSLIDGILLQLINPKAYVVNTSLFSGFPLGFENLGFETVVKFIIVNAIWIPIHLIWLMTGVTLHKLDLSTPVQRTINICMALAMIGVVALAAYSAR